MSTITETNICKCVSIDGNKNCLEQLRTPYKNTLNHPLLDGENSQEYCSFFISDMIENVDILLDYDGDISVEQWRNWESTELNAIFAYIADAKNVAFPNGSFINALLPGYFYFYKRINQLIREIRG